MSNRIYKTAPAGSSRPYTLNWLNLSKYCQETELLPMVLLRWLSSWFLISRETFKVHQKDTLDLAIHSSCLKDLHDRGCLRLKQVLSREFKSTSPPLTFFPSSTHISPLVTGILYFADWTGLDWTSKTRTSKTRTGKTRTGKTRTSKTRTGKTRTSKTRTSKTRTGKTRTSKTPKKCWLY